MAGQYRDNAPGANSDGDLQDDYYHLGDSNLPPPHRLPGADDPYASFNHSSSAVHQTIIPDPPINYRSPPAMNNNPGSYANLDTPYSNAAYSSSQWLEKQQASSRRSKYIVIGSLITLIILIGVGVGVGVGVSNSKHTSSNAASGSATGPSGVVNQTNPNDPSTFIPDSNLRKVFYGLSYTPTGSQLPSCGNSLADVIEDIQLMSQLTSRIHLYGADCNQTALVLEAIRQTKVNMSVFVADYNVPTNSTPYVQQRDYIIDALKTYGTDNILGVLVGNEYILDYLGAYGGTSPNDAVGNAGAELLISNITDMRSTLAANGFGSLPVGTADAGAYFNNQVLQNVDFAMSNIHPWFANVSIQQSAGWTYDFLQQQNVAITQGFANNPKWYIGETGWPSNSTNIQNESNGPSNASVENLQYFINTFVCESNQNGTGYFYFEFMDETWQALEFGGVEGSWGLFYPNKTLKSITFPNCTAS